MFLKNSGPEKVSDWFLLETHDYQIAKQTNSYIYPQEKKTNNIYKIILQCLSLMGGLWAIIFFALTCTC